VAELAARFAAERPEAFLWHANAQGVLPGADLMSGGAGIALFLATLSVVPDYEDSLGVALEYLDQSIGGIEKESLPPKLGFGYVGIGFAAQMVGQLYPELEVGNLCEMIDRALLRFLDQSESLDARYTLLNGLVGIGIYALERRGAPAGTALLERVIVRLTEMAERQPGGCTWYTPSHLIPVKPGSAPEPGRYNLGLAHGVPGVIGLLARSWAAGVERPRIEGCLAGAVRWLLAQELSGEPYALFPKWIIPGDEVESRRPAIPAWCYGEPSVAACLFLAGRATGTAEWEAAGLRIARSCAQRPMVGTSAVEAQFCHGAAGPAHILNLLFQSTGDPLLREGALRYVRRILEARADASQGFAGFQSQIWVGGPVWSGVPGLLEGAAGIGLVLLAAITSTAPLWDRCFGISGID
jgi:lantibiotic modifying enzyme